VLVGYISTVIKMTILEVKDLKKHYTIGGLFSSKYLVKAVDGVSFKIEKGDNFALVGESGCGKSTIAKIIARLIEPTAGTVFFKGNEIFHDFKNKDNIFRRNIQMIFQDVYASLNPRRTVFQIISDPLKNNKLGNNDAIFNRVVTLLKDVGLTPFESFIYRFPHQLSGGQRQRVGIARALSLEPSFILADEPVSALDMTVRTQILLLLKALQVKHNLTFFFITHDLSVVRAICNKVTVMYLGRIMEMSPTEDLFKNPSHPYTQALISATPIPNPEKARQKKKLLVKGETPSPINPPSGCHFHTRCQYTMDICKKAEPELLSIGKNRFASCHKLQNS